MKIQIHRSKEKPPIFDRCVEQFGANWESTIFTYGDTIHCKYRLSDQKFAHERVHVKQQLAYGVEAWWERYFSDSEFRLIQEVEAYCAEAVWVRTKVHDLKRKHQKLDKIIFDLSSSLYGNMITFEEAKALINS